MDTAAERALLGDDGSATAALTTTGCGGGDLINVSCRDVVTDVDAASAAADDSADAAGTRLSDDVGRPGPVTGWTVTGDRRARTHTVLLGRTELDVVSTSPSTIDRPDDETLRVRDRRSETGDWTAAGWADTSSITFSEPDSVTSRGLVEAAAVLVMRRQLLCDCCQVESASVTVRRDSALVDGETTWVVGLCVTAVVACVTATVVALVGLGVTATPAALCCRSDRRTIRDAGERAALTDVVVVMVAVVVAGTLLNIDR